MMIVSPIDGQRASADGGCHSRGDGAIVPCHHQAHALLAEFVAGEHAADSPLVHDAAANRLFWRVDDSAVLSAFHKRIEAAYAQT